MEDMLPEIENNANALLKLLQEHNGQNAVLLDLRKFKTWADFFLVTTVTSGTHMDGLARHIKEFCHDREIDIFGFSRKELDDQWRLLDLGAIIVHLMSSSAREFYELERLWSV